MHFLSTLAVNLIGLLSLLIFVHFCCQPRCTYGRYLFTSTVAVTLYLLLLSTHVHCRRQYTQNQQPLQSTTLSFSCIGNIPDLSSILGFQILIPNLPYSARALASSFQDPLGEGMVVSKSQLLGQVSFELKDSRTPYYKGSSS